MTVKTNEVAKAVEEFIVRLTTDMEDDIWSIVGVVEVEEYEENGQTYGKVEGDKFIYTKQDEVFIKQWTGYLGDDYSGYLLKPLNGTKYVKISYSC